MPTPFPFASLCDPAKLQPAVDLSGFSSLLQLMFVVRWRLDTYFLEAFPELGMTPGPGHTAGQPTSSPAQGYRRPGRGSSGENIPEVALGERKLEAWGMGRRRKEPAVGEGYEPTGAEGRRPREAGCHRHLAATPGPPPHPPEHRGDANCQCHTACRWKGWDGHLGLQKTNPILIIAVIHLGNQLI